MLDELYFAAEAHLAGKPPRADAERLARVGTAVLEAAKEAGAPQAEVESFLATMPERYLLANSPGAIVQHARVVGARSARSAHVARVQGRHPEAAELCVVADDRPGLLASIAAAITANRLEVLAAQVYSRGAGERVEAVDLFWVRDRDGGTEGVAEAMPTLERDLEDVCSGRVSPSALLRSRTGSESPWRERPSPAVPTEILFDHRASPRRTVIEVYAKDRPGLLYTVANALHELGLTITLSKINTEGARVADVFYVGEVDGAKIAPGPRCQEIRDALTRAIAG
jgi:[protein-PII] uridylyltransferase